MITREQAIEAAKRWPFDCHCNESGYPHAECSMARYILQPPPLAWDEKRAKKWVFDLLVDVRRMDQDHPLNEDGNERKYKEDDRAWREWHRRKAAELSSMPGGRVDGEALEAANRLTANSWDTYCGEPGKRNWMDIANAILNDGRLVAKSILSGRGADDSGEAS